ncbi:MAG: winged helix DNA-binding domain-containing protein, partial [Anaerolineae bacterium]|nr:winged helix DNA-binding domain-containing protein [Anaerolineae bacterium]
MSEPVYTLQAARALALHAQALTTPNGQEPAPTPDTIYNLIVQLTAVQIDTLQMVRRSHYVTLWSRLGPYDLADFERLAYDSAHRRLYEYWHHAACLIPLEHFRWSTAKMEQIKDWAGWRRNWALQPGNQEIIAGVRQRITEEGALRTSDFKDTRDQRASWWDWKPAKNALEYLYDRG